MLIRRLLISLASLVLAAVSGAAAVGQIYEKSRPQLAAAMIPMNGLAEARLSSAIAEAALQAPGKTVDAPLKTAIELARDAYAREPLAAMALRTAALAEERLGRDKVAKDLFSGVSKLTKRDVVSEIWLAAYLAKREEVPLALRHYDNALRVSIAARDLLLPRLRLAISQDIAIDPVIDLLIKNPEWSEEFWAGMAQVESSVINGARVRIELYDRKVDLNPAFDQQLIDALLQQNQFDLAERLFLRASSRTWDQPDGELIRNWEFAFRPELTPFAWQTFPSDNLEVFMDPTAGELVFLSDNSSAAVVARNIITVQPGKPLAIEAKFAAFEQAAAGNLALQLFCARTAAGRSAPVTTFALDEPTVSERFVPAGDCRHYWVQIYLRPNELRRNLEFRVSSLSIRPASAAAARPAT